jgi:hypothetical protein
MNLKKLSHKGWLKLAEDINSETFTQMELAPELKRSTRTVKKQDADGKLKPIEFKSTKLYPKELNRRIK